MTNCAKGMEFFVKDGSGARENEDDGFGQRGHGTSLSFRDVSGAPERIRPRGEARFKAGISPRDRHLLKVIFSFMDALREALFHCQQ